MEPLILVDASPSFDSPQPDRATSSASALRKTRTPTRRVPRLPNIGSCFESIPWLITVPFTIRRATLPVRLNTSTEPPTKITSLDNVGDPANTSPYGELKRAARPDLRGARRPDAARHPR